MRLAWEIAVALLRRRGTALLRTSALAALVAVALGVASLVVVLALMTGYAEALRSGLLSSAGHIVAVFPLGLTPERASELAPAIAGETGATSVGQVAYLPGLLLRGSAENAEIVTVKASGTPPGFAGLPAGQGEGPLQVAVGSGVARRLSLREGDVAALELVAQGGAPRSLAVRVAKVFEVGLAEIDDRWVFVRVGALGERFSGLAANALEISLSDPEDAESLRPAVEEICGSHALVTTWSETNRNLFAALRWQKLSLAIVLSLVVGVGAFEVASALVVMVTEKRRQFGILLALGARPGLLRATMLAAGGALGFGGLVAGLGLGLGIVGLMTALGVPSFPPEIASIYMVDHIPLLVLPGDLLVVSVIGLIEVLLAAAIPARRIGTWEPAEVLRWV